MNFENLKPWNWFKHEDDTNHQIPVAKKNDTSDVQNKQKKMSLPHNKTTNTLLQLHQEMDQWFDDVWRSFSLPNSFLDKQLVKNPLLGDYRASLDVSGNEKEYEISIDLPGMTEDDIDININGNVLTIKGKKEEKSESKDKHYYRIERNLGSFQRTLSLPEDSNVDAISANIKNGLLEINIPRKALPKDKAKQIPISS